MPQKLHISIPKLKRSPSTYFTSKLTHLFSCCEQPKTLSPTMDPYKSYPHRSSNVINSRMGSPGKGIFDSTRSRSMDPTKNLRESHQFVASPHKSSLPAEEVRDNIFVVAMRSTEPQVEFYTSMVEVVRSRLQQDLPVDWAYMSDLLGCYCEINEKRSHKYIVRAFMDVVEDLHQILS